HGQHIARGSDLLDQMPLTFADQRSAGVAGTNELDDPRATPAFQFGKLERPRHAMQRRIGELLRFLAIRDKSVELEVCVELALLREEKREQIDLVNLHH